VNELQTCQAEPFRFSTQKSSSQSRTSCLWFLLIGFIALLLLAGCAPKSMPASEPGPLATLTPDLRVAQAALNLPPRQPRFESISVAQGLSESVVHQILQDHQGFLWFATDDGLNRYDGYTFQIYRNDPGNPHSLAHNTIYALLEDREGRIWIGLANSGVNRLDPLTGEVARFRFNGDDSLTLASNRVRTLLEDRSGNIWAGSLGAGLLRFDPEKNEFERILIRTESDDLDSYNSVYSLLQDSRGTLWVGTAKGLYTFDPAARTFTPAFPSDTDPQSYANNAINTLYQDSTGVLWIGTEKSGLLRLDPASRQLAVFPPGENFPAALNGKGISAVLIDRSDVLWLGTWGGGLCRRPMAMESSWEDPASARFECFQNDVFQPDSLGSNNVGALYEDRSGVIWIGTYGSGVNKLLPAYKPFLNIQNDPQNPASLSTDMVFALFFDGPNTLWAGTLDQGLERIDLQTGAVTHYRNQAANPDSLSDNFVRTIYRDSRGALWIGTQKGLNRLDEKTGKFIRYLAAKEKESGVTGEDYAAIPGDRIADIVETADGALWLGLDRVGLCRFDPVLGTFTLYPPKPGQPNSLADASLFDLYVDPNGAIWIGTARAGLERFDPRSEVFTHFAPDSSVAGAISDPTVLWVQRDSRGTLWAATAAGLNRLDPATGSFRAYRTGDGLPNDFVYTFLEDEQNRLWLTTNKGIARLDPQTGEVKSFDVHDGLQSDEFNSGAAARAPDGRMAFAGIHGITVFYPQQVRDNPYVPPVALTSVTQHGKAVNRQPGEVERILVKWPDNYFDFEFTALSYTPPEKNQYAYLLENFDREWNVTGTRREGRYTNLPGGTYTLRIRGSNNDGVWNETGAALIIQVIPPIWQTWWFEGGLALLVIGAVGATVRLRLRGMETRTRELERMVRTRTAEIEHLFEQNKELAVVEERNRLARDLHDSAKQRAFAALAQIGAVNSLLRSDPRKAQAALAEAETLVYEVIEELTFLIQEMYPVALKEKGLAAMLREYLYEWESRNEIRVDYSVENERRVPLNIEQALYRVTQEALANVARHSQARRVSISLVYFPGQVTVRIADDGKGFDAQNRPAGIGLRSMRERIQMIGGTLQIDSEPGKGTSLFAWAPLQPAPAGLPMNVVNQASFGVRPPVNAEKENEP
jgi:signal transduction histidine kinase/ligand-binding sensor domain-containing protein